KRTSNCGRVLASEWPRQCVLKEPWASVTSPSRQAEHMAAQPANVKISFANSEPSTHGTSRSAEMSDLSPQNAPKRTLTSRCRPISIYEDLGDATKERWNAPGFREKRHAPVCPCPHVVACGLCGRIGADGDARQRERPLQLQSCGRRRAAARHPHRPGVAVQPERRRLGLQDGSRRALGAGDRGRPPAARERDAEEGTVGRWAVITRCFGPVRRKARRAGPQAAER